MNPSTMRHTTATPAWSITGPNVTDELSKTNAAPAPQKPPRRQHVVPQFYLARFADDRDQLLMTDKTRERGPLVLPGSR
jgi:hypothetical protein